jgi:hypothetical protein
MEILFDDRELQAVAESRVRCDREYGDAADTLRQRLCELAAAETLRVAMSVPTLRITQRCERGGFAMEVSTGLRVVVQAEPESLRDSGRAIDYADATCLRIVAIEKTR